MQTKLVGERADRLATALTGENKTQGNFGELRLRTLLEIWGLKKACSLKSKLLCAMKLVVLSSMMNGKKMIPDVILHFPDERDVVIEFESFSQGF